MPRDEPRRELYEGETVVAISRIAVSASGRVAEAGPGSGETKKERGRNTTLS
jgi:hypothetical protein